MPATDENPTGSSSTLEVAPLGAPRSITDEQFADASGPAPASRFDNAVEAWFTKHFMGLGGRLDVEMYNVAHAAKEDLKKILAAL